MRRVGPAIALFFLSPLVAEFLLGDFGLSALVLLFALAPMYGGGAVLIREIVRRTGRGWPSIVLLALAYALLEEGFVTMSLFNPDYLDAHLLDQGFVPALGIAIPWTVYVLALHTVWSISVPVALIEEWTDRRTTPWLRTPGLIVVAAVFAAGVVLDFVFSYGNGHYLAPWPQLLVTGIAVVLLVVAAFRLPRRSAPVPATPRRAPAPSVVLVATLAIGALFMAAQTRAVGVRTGIALLVGALVLAAVAIGVWSRSGGWGAWHRYAAAAGGLLTYAWHSFFTHELIGGGRVMEPVSHVVFALAAVALLAFEARRIRRRSAAPVVIPATGQPHGAVAAS